MATQNPFERYTQACQRARAAGLLVIDRGDRFLVYRRMPTRNVFIASCSTPDSLGRTVARCAGSNQPKGE